MKHKWNKTQQKALKSSILHWERMRDDKRRKFRGFYEEPYNTNCACCKKFQYKTDSACGNCPIKAFSGKIHCYGTPYYEAEDAYSRNNLDSPQFKQAAQKMINFMNKVLRAGDKK